MPELIDLDAQSSGFSDIQDLLVRLEASAAPEELKDECRKMIVRVYRMAKRGSYSSEYDSVSKYIDWVVRIPWGKYTNDIVDLNNIKEELDKYHYGLGKVKEKILSYMAVIKLRDFNGNSDTQEVRAMTSSVMRPPVLCFVGLQGLGKTTIAKSIANALGRKFERISLAAFGSIGQLRGISKTEPDAEPGQLLQAIVRSGSMNPVIILDEIDKSSGIESLRNDIMASLLEILDPAQNDAFQDRYINYPMDLSKIFFITTANTLATISAALLDRLEVIRFTSYSDEEKIVIGKSYVLPRVLAESGLKPEQLMIEESAWPSIVRPMGFDAGIRQLERTLMNLARRVALELLSGQTFAVRITTENVRTYLSDEVNVIA